MKIKSKILIAFLAIFMVACQKTSVKPVTTQNPTVKITPRNMSAQGGGIYYGPPTAYNNSTIRSYFINDQANAPVELGFELDDAVLQNLPNPNAPEEQQILVSLPNQAQQLTLFNHLTFQFNPHGHDPQFAYGVPHCDFHFYQIPVAQRLTIDINNPAIMNPPDPSYIPDGYNGPVGPISQMGSHFIDVQAPEFNGGTFTKTFIYGSYDGNVIFEELMATLVQLNAPTAEINIRQPRSYQNSGYYPVTYGVARSNGKTYVYVKNFIYREGAAVM